MMKKPLCILANSVKNNPNSCIAGIQLQKTPEGKWHSTGTWIRPISHREAGAVSRAEAYLKEINRVPQLFDIVEVPLERRAHVHGQPEDWLITKGEPWRYLGYFNPQKSIASFLEEPPNLWLEENERRDRVTPDFVAQHELPSLYLVRPERLTIYINEIDYGYGPARSRRASFRYRGVIYDFGMTDPVASSKYFPDFGTMATGISAGFGLRADGICVSLAPAWKGDLSLRAYHFKLVAAIVESA